ncbi:hypothetical protein GGR58DRAFT_514230 [Xylaria digitata]|nr:hypothetical protein GGR58DRAFT_514230 [Xylaria digitata]
MIGFLGPGFLLGMALGRLSSARRCVKLFRKDDYLLNGTKWTYRYAFFVDMGGIHLTSPDFPNGFPITGEQLHYLVKNGYVDFSDMKTMAIDERNTTDTYINVPFDDFRLITIWQVLWFSVAEIQRVRNGLPTTTLELTALSYVVVTVATSICWFRKPPITIPRMIPTKGGKLIYEIRAEAKEKTHCSLNIEVWYRTPVDFAGDTRWGIDAHWSYYTRLSHIMHLKIVSRPLKSRPWDRFPSDQWLPPGQAFVPFGSFKAFALYHSVFVVYGGVYYLIEAFRWEKRRSKKSIEEATSEDYSPERTLILPVIRESDIDSRAQLSGRVPTQPVPSKARLKWYWRAQLWITSWRNISVDKDPEMAVPLRVVVPVTATCVLFIFARLFLYVEDFASLRLQPANIYETVNRFIPFLGDG